MKTPAAPSSSRSARMRRATAGLIGKAALLALLSAARRVAPVPAPLDRQRLIHQYRSLRPSPTEPTLGAEVMVNLSALTMALYRELLGEGLTRADAREVTARSTWIVYRRLAQAGAGAPRLITRSPLRRVRLTMLGFIHLFPYRRPGYEIEIRPDAGRSFSFDVARCPAADFFRAAGEAELCGRAWCDLDFPLATMWGVELSRPMTLAKGDTRCDFTFSEPEESPLQVTGSFSAGCVHNHGDSGEADECPDDVVPVRLESVQRHAPRE